MATISPQRTAASKGTATVTMMLAERIIRNDWSIEEDVFFEPNSMNVWQTLEFLSNISLRRRYNYEGYNDSKNTVRMLTPSWRRDGYVEKIHTSNTDETSKKSTSGEASAAVASTATHSQFNNNKTISSTVPVSTSAQHLKTGRLGSAGNNRINSAQKLRQKKNVKVKNNGKYISTKPSYYMVQQKALRNKLSAKALDPEYALSPADYADLIKCTFNIPRISAALERLMGTNVVRLTDRNYMKELRERIDDDYRQNLQKRIRARELKEVERERVLIIEGKCSVIPEELADDPIFVVNAKAGAEIIKSKAKLKTNREKNSDRLKSQSVKCEKERIIHEAEETKRLDSIRQRYLERKNKEEEFKEENAELGVDLIRILNEDWLPCEQRFKEFIEEERAKMKERSWKIPTLYTSDPKDMDKILRARKKFRQTEKKIRKALELQHQESTATAAGKVQSAYKVQESAMVLQSRDVLLQKTLPEEIRLDDYDTDFIETMASLKPALRSEEASDISSGESFDEGSTISVSKQKYATTLQKELEHDVNAGRLISKEQYDHLRFEDQKIMQLKNARDISELYKLAEEIIIGERVPDEEEQPPTTEGVAVAEENKD